MKKAFTLIEILVVVTIIGMLITIGLVNYSQFTKQSRDARRRADIEQLRAALEQYRSDNGYYPASCTQASCAALTGSPKYIQSFPLDPLTSSNYVYRYFALTSANNTGCAGNTCVNYVLGAALQTVSGSGNCSSAPYNPSICVGVTTSSCNYCVGPYGAY